MSKKKRQTTSISNEWVNAHQPVDADAYDNCDKPTEE